MRKRREPTRPYVLCLRADVATDFTDNEYGVCVRCACQVQHRPHVPTPNHLVCMDCFKAVQTAAGGAIQFAVTRETMTEVRDAIRRQFFDEHKN